MGFLAFFTMGLLQAGYGPSYPTLAREFQLTLDRVAFVTSLHFFGSASGPLLLGVLLTRLSLRNGLGLGSLLLVLGVAGVALASSWPLLLAAALLGGLGFGMLSAGFNLVFAELGPGPANLVNGVFGVGSVVSPLLVLAAGQQAHAPPFWMIGVLAAVLVPGVRVLRPRPVQAAQEQGADGWSRPLLALFLLAFFLYVGIETGLGSWITAYLQAQRSPRPELITSLYWLALTVGRFVFAFLGSRVSMFATLLFGSAGAALCALAAALPVAAPVAFVLAGFCVAPLFATLLSWLTRVLPSTLAPYALTVGSLGGAVLPALSGLLSRQFGMVSIPLTSAAVAALLLALVLLIRRQAGSSRPRQPQQSL